MTLMRDYRTVIHRSLVLFSMVCVSSVATLAIPAPENTIAEYGYRLTPEEAREGWISLFDGETTFGWKGGAVHDGRLGGGTTTTEFGDYELQADVATAGKLAVGKGQTIDVPSGSFKRTVENVGRGPLQLGEGVSFRALAIRPLGLKTVFDGKSLDGWKRLQRTKPGETPLTKWDLEEGVLHAVGGPEAMELVGSNYGDLVLQVTVKTRRTHANGGVFFRAIPGDFMNGYEAQIHNRTIENVPGGPLHVGTGGIDDRQVNRRLVSRDGEPFTMTIVAVGPHICTWVNGYQVIDWIDSRKPHKNARAGSRVEPGAVQLQAHDEGTDLEFREVRVGELK